MKSVNTVFRFSLVCVCLFALGRTVNAYTFLKQRTALDSLAVQQENLLRGVDGAVIPSEYIVGPGDKLSVYLRGLDEQVLQIIVDVEGNIVVPKCGILPVSGKTLAEAKTLIAQTVQKYYKNIEILVSLNEFRWIKASIHGLVRKAGSFTFRSNTRLFDAINTAGGLLEKANQRLVSVRNRTGVVTEYDLLSFTRLGEQKQNPYLVEGDYIFVDARDAIVFVDGAVKFPGNYDLKMNETANGLLQLCGGLLESARTDSIELIRYAADKLTQQSMYYSLSELRLNKGALLSHDRIVVREEPLMYKPNLVYLEGQVTYPGVYKILENQTTLTDIIAQAGGFLPNASLADATVSRQSGNEEADPEYERLKQLSRADMTDDEYDYIKSKSRQRKGRLVVDFGSLFNKNSAEENIILRNNDLIQVPEQRDYITIIGQVVEPGKIPYKQGLNIEDYITLAGGYAWRALKKDVRLVKANTGEWVDADDVEAIQPGDIIWVPEDPPPPRFWDLITKTLNIVGQVATVVAATVAVIVATR